MENRELQFWDEEKKKRYAAAIRMVIDEIYRLDVEYYKKSGNHFIRFVEHRLKSTESILSKLDRKHKGDSNQPIEELLNDIAGVRVICFDKKQIYKIVKMIKQSKIFTVLKEKDYVKNPKENGYQSYHLILMVDEVKVELQLRTILMDAWSSLESIVIYKKETPIPEKLQQDIQKFSKWSKKMDKMFEGILEDTIKE
ncbi:MAG: GTP pyrophosphokinase family protein [Lachnospiraceae bacterium]